jgi:hypothetical protein
MHLTRSSKKDEDHKKHLDSLESTPVEEVVQEHPGTTSFKIYKPGEIVSFQGKGRFVVIEDRGAKLIVKREGSNLLTLTIKKERI